MSERGDSSQANTEREAVSIGPGSVVKLRKKIDNIYHKFHRDQYYYSDLLVLEVKGDEVILFDQYSGDRHTARNAKYVIDHWGEYSKDHFQRIPNAVVHISDVAISPNNGIPFDKLDTPVQEGGLKANLYVVYEQDTLKPISINDFHLGETVRLTLQKVETDADANGTWSWTQITKLSTQSKIVHFEIDQRTGDCNANVTQQQIKDFPSEIKVNIGLLGKLTPPKNDQPNKSVK